jgi:hypothetical protein
MKQLIQYRNNDPWFKGATMTGGFNGTAQVIESKTHHKYPRGEEREGGFSENECWFVREGSRN